LIEKHVRQVEDSLQQVDPEQIRDVSMKATALIAIVRPCGFIESQDAFDNQYQCCIGID
jgi:hypothetical protein